MGITSFINTTNDVKQDKIISPILFCVYMEGLLNELEEKHFGCNMDKVFVGVFAYADNLTLLTPGLFAMCKLTEMCEKYDVIFKSKRS